MGIIETQMDLVGKKITAAKRRLMANGQRDMRGFIETADRIRKGANNMYFSLGSDCFEPVSAVFQNFSQRPGLNDVKNVAGVDIVDINILATQDSVMGYLSAERGMDKPIDTAFYQTLESLNNAGGFQTGDTVFSPFRPINTRTDLASAFRTADVTGSGPVDLGASPLAKKGITVSALDSSGAVIGTGRDDGEGRILFDLGSMAERGTVDYNTGVVTITGAGVGTGDIDTMRVVAIIDRTSERDGANTLKTKPVTKTVQLTAVPNRIILENSFEDNAWLNKQTYNLSSIGVSMDFGKRAVAQLLQVYTYFLDLTSVRATATVMLEQDPSEDLDLTSYTLSTSEASTKNDIVNQYVLKLIKTLQRRSGKGPTAYLVCAEGAIVLGNNPLYFQSNANFDQNIDGMVGTYRGVPVIRHHSLDFILDPTNGTERFAFIGALYKDPSGQLAPSMFGEFIPPYSVVPALNYENPAQFSQALLSMSTTEPLVRELAAYMRVRIAA